MRKNETIFTHENSTLPCLCVCVKFQLSISDSSRNMTGSQIYNRGAAPLRRPCEKKIIPEKLCYPVCACKLSTFYLW